MLTRVTCALAAVASWSPSAAAVPFGEGAAAKEPSAQERPERAANGAYASFSLGPGYFHAVSGDRADQRTFSAETLSFQLALGARLRSGVAVAGAIHRDHVFDLSASDEVIDGDEPDLRDIRFTQTSVGFLTDFQPAVLAGLHGQIFVGYGVLSVGRPTRGADREPNGFVLAGGLGYDFRLGSHASLGALLRASYSTLGVDERSGSTVIAVVPCLLASLSVE